MNFPFEIVRVAGSEALDKLAAYRGADNVYPVLIGDADDIERLLENHEFSEESPDELLQAAAEIDPQSWLDARVENDPEYYTEDRGDWPDDVPASNAFIGHLDILTSEPFDEVGIALLPIKDSWDVPCHLKFGGWNECPFPAEHSALFRHWYEKYGAEVVTMTGDTVEMRVQRPPKTREEALALAKEQYVYCADIVQQGTGTIDALAATLLNATVWFFWWD